MKSNEETSLKTVRGTVLSNTNDKTVVVEVSRVKTHPLYSKKYSVSKKYKAHDENNEYKIGEVVEIAPSRPFSRDKKYKVIRKIA